MTISFVSSEQILLERRDKDFKLSYEYEFISAMANRIASQFLLPMDSMVGDTYHVQALFRIQIRN